MLLLVRASISGFPDLILPLQPSIETHENPKLAPSTKSLLACSVFYSTFALMSDRSFDNELSNIYAVAPSRSNVLTISVVWDCSTSCSN